MTEYLKRLSRSCATFMSFKYICKSRLIYKEIVGTIAKLNIDNIYTYVSLPNICFCCLYLIN